MKTALNYFFTSICPYFIMGAVQSIIYLEGERMLEGGELWFVHTLTLIILSMYLLTDIIFFIKKRSTLKKGQIILIEFRIFLISTSLFMYAAHLTQLLMIFLPLVLLIILYTATFSSTITLISVSANVIIFTIVEGGGPGSAAEVFVRAFFLVSVVTFGAFGRMFLKVELWLLKQKNKKAIENYFNRTIEISRGFRFIKSGSSDYTGGYEDEKKVKIYTIQGAYNEVRKSIWTLINLLKTAFDLHTCAVLWLDSSGENLRVIEASSLSDNINVEPFPAGEGITGTVVSSGEQLSLCPVKNSSIFIPYYSSYEQIQSISICPIFDEGDGKPRGILCADRLNQKPFTEKDEEVFKNVSNLIAAAIATERTLMHIAYSKHQQSKLLLAVSRLKDAMTIDEVVDVIFQFAKEVTKCDFAVFTAYDKENNIHIITHGWGKGAESLKGIKFSGRNGLVAQSLKLNCLLPYKGEYDPANHIVFDERIKFKQIKSLLVYPLTTGKSPLGTLVIGAERRNGFNREKRKLLQIIVDQSAIAYQNGLAMRKLEEMATTDGLTGLSNKRVLMNQLNRRFEGAQRHGKNLSVIMADLDHFKSVNDTYGHAVGDEVLKLFAKVLKENARQIDLAARFGGEEFVLLCEETSKEGAVKLAERIRRHLESKPLNLPTGKQLKVTCSIGVSTYPDDGNSPHGLLEVADAQLYRAKKSGRNRVCASNSPSIKKAC